MCGRCQLIWVHRLLPTAHRRWSVPYNEPRYRRGHVRLRNTKPKIVREINWWIDTLANAKEVSISLFCHHNGLHPNFLSECCPLQVRGLKLLTISIYYLTFKFPTCPFYWINTYIHIKRLWQKYIHAVALEKPGAWCWGVSSSRRGGGVMAGYGGCWVEQRTDVVCWVGGWLRWREWRLKASWWWSGGLRYSETGVPGLMQEEWKLGTADHFLPSASMWLLTTVAIKRESSWFPTSSTWHLSPSWFVWYSVFCFFKLQLTMAGGHFCPDLLYVLISSPATQEDMCFRRKNWLFSVTVIGHWQNINLCEKIWIQKFCTCLHRSSTSLRLIPTLWRLSVTQQDFTSTHSGQCDVESDRKLCN